MTDLANRSKSMDRARTGLNPELRSHELISTACHELRTPLSTLETTLELLRAEVLTGAARSSLAATHADRALWQTRRLVRLAGDLLDLSCLDADVPLALDEPIELGELARTIGREFVPRLRAGGRRLLLDGGPAVALGDPMAVARILRILLDNAAAYGAGTVAVELSSRKGDVRLAVADHGPGVARDEREHIFGRFVHGRATSHFAHGDGRGTRARDRAGTGAGNGRGDRRGPRGRRRSLRAHVAGSAWSLKAADRAL